MDSGEKTVISNISCIKPSPNTAYQRAGQDSSTYMTSPHYPASQSCNHLEFRVLFYPWSTGDRDQWRFCPRKEQRWTVTGKKSSRVVWFLNFIYLFFFFFLFWARVSHHILGWPKTHYVAQARLWTHNNLHASPSPILGLQVRSIHVSRF